MSGLTRLARQVQFDLLIFRRNPAATFFTLALPLIFLFIFTSIFGNQTLENGAKVSTLYVPGILALSIVSSTAVNLAITMTTRRERGVLKRVRGTPMPPWVFIASQALAGFVLSLIMTVLITLIGRVIYDVELNVESIPSLLITLLVGAMSFSAIGIALTAIIPSEDAAPAVTNAVMLPLYFISDVFVPSSEIPGWVDTAAGFFPIQHLARALQDSYDPFLESTPWPWDHWVVIALWGVGSAAVALKFFRWTPRR